MKHLRKAIIVLLLCSGFQTVAAQESKTTVIGAQNNRFEPSKTVVLQPQSTGVTPIVGNYHKSIVSDTLRVNPKAVELNNANLPPAYLLKWNGGVVYGAQNQWVTQGAGFGNSASLMGAYNVGDWSFDGDITVAKSYMSGMGIANSALLNLNIGYQFNDNISVTLMGGVRNTGFLSGAGGGMMDYHYGGYFTLQQEDENYGVSLGVRRYYNSATGQWTTMPVVAPYVKLWGQKMQMDFGGLLLNMFQGLDKKLNPHHFKGGGGVRGGGIIMPEVQRITISGSPDIPYIK